MRGGGGCASACEFLGPVLPLFMSATYDDSPEHRCRYTIEICSRDVSGSSKGTHLATSALLLSLSLSLSFSLSRFSARNRGSRSEFTKRGRREGEGERGGGKKRRHGIGGQIDCSFIPRRFKADPARISRAGGAALRDL